MTTLLVYIHYFCRKEELMIKKTLLIALLGVMAYGCSNSSGADDPGTTPDNFDRGAMLTNVADNIIIPAMQDFSAKMTMLKTAGQTFTATPDQTNLDALRTAWYNAYKVWQYVEMFNIGKAEEVQYLNFMNIYPVTVADVESNIASGTYDLNHVNNHDAQGFPALDYLLYGVAANDVDIIAKYTTNANAANYKTYITDVLNKMDELTQQVLTDWTGAYRNTFVNSTTNTSTSSLNKLVNDYIFYYEKGLRANKIGIPAGIFSTGALPEKVEAFYRKDISKELVLEALTAVQDLFNGKHYGSAATGESFSSYLSYLNRSDISTSILNQYNSARTQINTLNANFFQQINTNNTEMTRSYDELQKAVVFLKVDMLQAFNVSVDFVDADGD